MVRVGGGRSNIGYSGPAWPASWGRTQFTTSTFLENVIQLADDPSLAQLNNGQRPFRDTAVRNIRSSLTPVLSDPTQTSQQQLAALGLNTPALLPALRTQYTRAESVRTYWNTIRQNVALYNDAYTPDYTGWSRDTGLSNADLDQLINWRRYRLAPAGPQKNHYRALIRPAASVVLSNYLNHMIRCLSYSHLFCGANDESGHADHADR